MATANSPLEFTGEQRATVGKLAMTMKVVAVVLLLFAAVNVAVGFVAVATTQRAGILLVIDGIVPVIEGVVTGLLGLIMLSSSADVGFMIETKYTAIHLSHVFQNLTMFYKTQFFLAVFLVVIALLRLFCR